MKHDALRGRLSSALLLILLLAQAASPALAAQSPPRRMLKEEEREARAVADAFTRRLIEARDFAPVVRELYADDFMAHYLKSESDWMARAETGSFMLNGMPGIFFKESLAARADDEYWPRFYVAAQSFLHFGFLSIFSRKNLKEAFGDQGDQDNLDERDMLDVYPPEAVEVLDGNPTLANFLKKKGRYVDVATPDDLRQVTTTLEEAVRLTRAHLDERLAKGTHLAENLRMMKAAAARTKVELLTDAEVMGYPADTRIFKVFAPIGYDLLLVKEGGSMKIVWASVPSD